MCGCINERDLTISQILSVVANDTSLILRSVYYRRPLALRPEEEELLDELLLLDEEEEDDPKLLLEDDLELGES